MTDYFCHQATSKGQSCIVVMSNGGAQRGHTVVTPEGVRHVFQHFGSGTFVGAHTYCCDKFILNPMVFREEYEKLKERKIRPVVYAHVNCMWSTPYDMIANQIIEENRGENRHGSCGMGIWETIVRYNESRLTLNIIEACNDAREYLKKVRTYYENRFDSLGIKLSNKWKEVFYNENLLINFHKDMEFMCNSVDFICDEMFLRNYQTVVFENGQGLMLDQSNIEYGDNTTPSNTGIRNPHEIIQLVFPDADVEVCYVTRTYLTRHGAGRFDQECDVALINNGIYDETNVYNEFQGNIRYGLLNEMEFLDRTSADALPSFYRWSYAVTHTNEYHLPKAIRAKYLSDGETRDSVKEVY